MTQTMIAVDSSQLDRIERKLDMLTPPRPQWLTIEDAAAQAGVTKATIQRWARKGEIETNGKSGGLRRVKLDRE